MNADQVVGLVFVAGLISLTGGVYVLAGAGCALLAAGGLLVALAFVWSIGLRNAR